MSKGSTRQKNFGCEKLNLIFRPPLIWLEIKQTDNMSSILKKKDKQHAICSFCKEKNILKRPNLWANP
jgi:uncharacterized Zn-finger protein